LTTQCHLIHCRRRGEPPARRLDAADWGDRRAPPRNPCCLLGARRSPHRERCL